MLEALDQHGSEHDAQLHAHKSALDGHGAKFDTRFQELADSHSCSHSAFLLMLNQHRSESGARLDEHKSTLDSHRDDLFGRLGDLSDARDVKHASLLDMFNEHQNSLDDRFAEHGSCSKRLLSVHRSELDTAGYMVLLLPNKMIGVPCAATRTCMRRGAMASLRQHVKMPPESVQETRFSACAQGGTWCYSYQTK